MTTLQRERVAAPAHEVDPETDPSQLAVYGGPRAVRRRYREGWRGVPWRGVVKVLRYALADVNTAARATGPVKELERGFARLTGCRHALMVNSGTAALHSAYYAVGVGPGDEVIVPAYTFFASASPILQCGGVPVFCDVDERTLTADPEDVEKRITPRTRAICVVHVWGNPAPMDRFVEIARRHNVALIEDCSHAHGATYGGRAVGSWGDVGCFSLQGNKPVSGGEAGIAVTHDPVLYDHMLALGHYGRVAADQQAGTYEIDRFSLGLKFRPHFYSACLAAESLKRLPELNRRRRRNYQVLSQELEGCAALQPVTEHPGAQRGGFMEYILRYEPDAAGGVVREAFVRAAAAEGVPVHVDRYTSDRESGYPLHKLRMFRDLDYSVLGAGLGGGANRYLVDPIPELPVTDRLAHRLVSLPAFTRVSERFVRECGRALRKVAEALPRIRDFRTGS